MAAAANDEARVGSSFDDGLHACTRRIRQHTFPFYSVGLDLLYGMALLTRLFLLTFAILCRRNFGCGLAQRVHWRSKEDGDMGHGQPSLLSQSSSLPTEDSCVATHAAHPDGCHRTGSATSGGGSYTASLGRLLSGTAGLSSHASDLPLADPLLPPAAEAGVARVASGESLRDSLSREGLRGPMLTLGSSGSTQDGSHSSTLLRGSLDRTCSFGNADTDAPSPQGGTPPAEAEGLASLAADEAPPRQSSFHTNLPNLTQIGRGQSLTERFDSVGGHSAPR